MRSNLFYRLARAGLALPLFALPALADEFHNVNQIVGDRALGMAGAYTAVSDDPAGLYYNPAGLVYATTNNISASVNSLQYRQIQYDDVLAGQYDWERTSTQLLPNFFGVVQTFGPFKVGISSSIPDSVSENQDQQFEDFGSIDRYVINLNRRDVRYNFGPGIAYELNDQFAVGLTLNYHYRVFESNINQYLRFNDDTLEWVNTYLETKEHGVRPKLGFMWSPADKVAIGLSIDRTLALASETQYQEARCRTGSGSDGCDADGHEAVPDIQTFDDIRNYPVQVRTGIAWFPNPALLLSADMIFHTGTEATETDDFILYSEREPTLDFAMGLEYYWTARYAVRGGVFTASANTPELETGQIFQDPHVDVYGLTASLSRFTRDSSISMGFMASRGEGKSQLFSDPEVELPLQNTTITEVSAFISTSYRY